jgi:hypothetical protein
MPIRAAGQTVGAININSWQKHAFDDDELRLRDRGRSVSSGKVEGMSGMRCREAGGQPFQDLNARVSAIAGTEGRHGTAKRPAVAIRKPYLR